MRYWDILVQSELSDVRKTSRDYRIYIMENKMIANVLPLGVSVLE